MLKRLQNAHVAKVSLPVPQRMTYGLRYAPNAIRSLRASRNLSMQADESTGLRKDTESNSFFLVKNTFADWGILICFFAILWFLAMKRDSASCSGNFLSGEDPVQSF